MITVVNIIPQSLSGETHQDSEPSIAVNPRSRSHLFLNADTSSTC